MKGLRQIVELLSAQFSITEAYAKQMSAMAFLFMTAHNPDIFEALWDREEKNDPEDWRSANVLIIPSEDGKTERRVAVMNIEGPMMRENAFCGPEGSISRAKRMRSLGEQDDIDAIVMKMYTPGGQVAGGEIFREAVNEVSEIKPVVVWAEMVASLGYNVAAGSSAIVLSGKDAMAGSIGTGFSYKDFSGFWEQKGIKEIEITAKTSPAKWKHNFNDPSEEEKREIAQDFLDPLDENFMDHVRENRPNVSAEALEGNIYYGEDAIANGLADHIGTFDFAVQLALDMAGKPGQINSNKMANDPKQTSKPSSGKTAEETGATATTQDTPTPETTGQTAQLDALNAQVQSQDRTIVALTQTIDTQGKTIETLQAEITRLQKLPSADTEAQPVASQEDLSQKTEEKPKSYSQQLRTTHQSAGRPERPVKREFVNLN